jgi:hypothetical protein
MTITMLMHNTVLSARNRARLRELVRRAQASPPA